MEPEISHRCKNCGAAIRASAQFCHQCGGSLGEPIKAASAPKDSGDVAISMKSKHKLPAGLAGTNTGNTDVKLSGEEKSEAKAQLEQDGAGVPLASRVIVVADVSNTKRQRVKEAARGVVADNVMPRVEKIRHASSVVFEEAAIDPSLRFILIALFLFIFFLVVLFLSFVK